ncbi:MAG: hypothetical protein ACI32N_10555 [Bulleidia sp.]
MEKEGRRDGRMNAYHVALIDAITEAGIKDPKEGKVIQVCMKVHACFCFE